MTFKHTLYVTIISHQKLAKLFFSVFRLSLRFRLTQIKDKVLKSKIPKKSNSHRQFGETVFFLSSDQITAVFGICGWYREKGTAFSIRCMPTHCSLFICLIYFVRLFVNLIKYQMSILAWIGSVELEMNFYGMHKEIIKTNNKYIITWL